MRDCRLIERDIPIPGQCAVLVNILAATARNEMALIIGKIYYTADCWRITHFQNHKRPVDCMAEQDNDRRRDVRVVFQTTVMVIFPDGRTFADCTTSDISVSGVFVNGVTGAASGEKCRVELQLTGKTSNLLLKMAAEIVRSQDDGVALEFFEVDDDSFYHLQNIVYFGYKYAGGQGDFAAGLDDIEDETLYYDLKSGKPASLPADYLDEGHDDGLEDFDADFDDLAEHIKHRQDDDDDADY